MADAETIIQDVAAFYRNFIDGFNREDTDLYLRSFCYHFALLHSSHLPRVPLNWVICLKEARFGASAATWSTLRCKSFSSLTNGL